MAACGAALRGGIRDRPVDVRPARVRLATAFVGALWNFAGTLAGVLVGGLIEFVGTF
jgi:hypothetical protein